jgi:serine/threonine protein kinase
MAPEAIEFTETSTDKNQVKVGCQVSLYTISHNHIKLGRASDIWSLGCILYQLIYGKPPFAELPMIQKLQAIINPNYIIQFGPVDDPCAIEVLKSCLNRNPKQRMTIPQLLQHQFLRPFLEQPDPTIVSISLHDIESILKVGLGLQKENVADVKETAKACDLFIYY